MILVLFWVLIGIIIDYYFNKGWAWYKRHKYRIQPIDSGRKYFNQKDIDLALQSINENLKYRLKQKGYRAFSSSHEIWGIVQEEVDELSEALKNNDPELFDRELSDIAVATIAGLASSKIKDW